MAAIGWPPAATIAAAANWADPGERGDAHHDRGQGTDAAARRRQHAERDAEQAHGDSQWQRRGGTLSEAQGRSGGGLDHR